MLPAPARRTVLACGLLLLSACSSGLGGGFERDERPSSTETVAPIDGELLAEPALVSDVVKRFIDGDSLEIMLNGQLEELRIRGINAPERFMCGGLEAKAALEDLLVPEGEAGIRTIELVVDPDEPRDRFGRVLADVVVGGQDVARQLVEDGFVIPLGGSSSPLHESARRASAAGLGLWEAGRCGPVVDGLLIESFVPNPAGPDDRPGAGEFIELRNVLDSDLDLAGWVVHDESTSNRFEFPPAKVRAGETFRLYSTCGEGGAENFYMCDSDSVWNNSGDTAFVVDPNGNVADFRFSP